MNFANFSIGLTACFLLSFIIGIERQYRRRYIGLRTIILVAIGSYFFVSFSFLVNGYEIDISRIAAQVVAGIGFLGAGVIIKDNENSKIKGLTTAATLWCDAAIGVLCAGGFIKEAALGTFFVLFSNVILRYVNMIINDKADEKNTVEKYYISFEDVKNSVITEIIENFANDKTIDILDYSVNKNKIIFNISVNKSEDKKIEKIVSKIVENHKLNTYEYKKINESKIDENEEL